MSGFDLIICEMALPDPSVAPDTLFQTRAFNGVFEDVYRITAEGELHAPAVEQVLSYGANQPVEDDTTTSSEAENRNPDFNGDIEFWNPQPPWQTFFACFIDGQCVAILTEGDYRAVMEKGRRRAVLEHVRDLARSKAVTEPSAARSQDFLHDDDGLPG